MIYEVSIAVQPSTSERSAQMRRIEVVAGVLERVWVGFPRGCGGLLHAQLWRAGTILIPFHKEESLAWDDYVFEFPMHRFVLDEPRDLILYAWNDDDTYQHRLLCVVSLVPLDMWYLEHPGYPALASGVSEVEL